MKKDLYEMADKVTDEQSFITFLAGLADDWDDEQQKEALNPSSPYGPGANGWENGTLGKFLESASRWAQDSINGLRFYEKPSNSWTRAAHILLAGKFYE